MKKNIPFIILIGSLILIIANLITSEKFDNGFWLRIASSILIIVAMITTIKTRKKEKSNH